MNIHENARLTPIGRGRPVAAVLSGHTPEAADEPQASARGRRANGWRGEGPGWEFTHVAIDDHSRIAFATIKPDEKAVSAIAFLNNAVAYFASLGGKVERVMTGNGSSYKSFAFAKLASGSSSGISAPNPTPLKPTTKPSASSRPRWAG